jgi:hypothetical protein
VEAVEFSAHIKRATVRATAPGLVSVAATDGRSIVRGSTTVQDPLTAIPLDGDWEFHFDRAGAETVRRPLGSWTALEPGFSGAGVYQKTFALDAVAGRGWTLDLGVVHEVAEVSVNGKALPAGLWAPYRFDVTSALRSGANTIVVKVTNTGANSHGQSIPSGLLGPVQLQPNLEVQVELRQKVV